MSENSAIVIDASDASCPRQRMHLVCDALHRGRRTKTHFAEAGDAVFECVPKPSGAELTLRRPGLVRSRRVRGELSAEKLEEVFFEMDREMDRAHDTQTLTTRRDLRQFLFDLVLGCGPREIDFGDAGKVTAKSFRGTLVLEVTAVNGDCVDPSSGRDWSVDALITLLDHAEKFLASRCPASTETPWKIARRRLRLRRKVRAYDAGYHY